MGDGLQVPADEVVAIGHGLKKRGHMVVGPLACGKNLERRGRTSIRQRLGPHAFFKLRAVRIAHVLTEIDGFDGRKVGWQVQSGDIGMELEAGCRVTGLEHGRRAARDIGIGLDSRHDGIARVVRMGHKALACIGLDEARGCHIKHQSNDQRQGHADPESGTLAR